MGRQKKNKPRRKRTPRLHVALAGYEAESLWASLIAAGASPALRARWPSVAALVHEVLATSIRGTRLATEADLPLMLAAVRASSPEVEMLEDFVAADPRLDVRVRLGHRAVRLFPGCIERPVADLDRAHLVAQAIDTDLIDAVGFGVSHLLDVILGYVDFAIEIMQSSWPDDLDDSAGEVITSAELRAARELVEAGTPRELTPTAEHELALQWITADSPGLPFSPTHPQSVFGRFARVRDESGTRWLPLAFMPEVLSFAVGRLARHVAHEPMAQMQLACLSADHMRRFLWRFTEKLLGAPDSADGPAVAPGNVVQWAVPTGSKTGLLVQLAANIDADAVGPHGEPAALVAARQSRTHSATRVPFPVGALRFHADVQLTPLLVASTADHTMSPQTPGLLAISLDDLRWIAQTADSDRDLFNFCRDMTRPDLPPIIGFEAIDYWEWWRANSKSVFSGGRAPSLISFSPHGGEAEWVRAGGLTPIELALARLELPATRELAAVENADEKVVTAYSWEPSSSVSTTGEHHRPELQAWSVWVGEAPIAVGVDSSSWSTADERRLLFDLAGSLAFGVNAVGAPWIDACKSAGIRAVRLDLVARPIDESDRTLVLADRHRTPAGTVVAEIAVDFERFLELGDGDPIAIQAEFARLVCDLLGAEGVEAGAVEAVSSAWLEARPTMTLDLVTTMAAHNHLPSPVELDNAYHSEVERLLAEKVRASGVRPGTYIGDEAKSLDHAIAELAREMLIDRLRGFGTADICTFAMSQLDRCVERRNRELRELRNIAATMDTTWDTTGRAAEVQSVGLRLRRCNEMILEGALMAGCSGTGVIDDDEWSRLLAVANAYYEATMRSEAIHYKVSANSLVVSDSYELSVTRTGADGGVDSESAFNLDERALALASASWEIADATPDADANEAQGEVEQAFAQAFGLSPMDLYATLLAAARTETASRHESVIVMSREEVVSHVLTETVLGDDPTGRARVEAAVDLLSTTAEGLLAEPWRPWLARTRKRRLLVQPFVRLDGQYLIAPHYTLASLAMYRRYIDQGQLPWSQPPAAPALERAMERFRDVKNRQLERAAASTLREFGFSVLENVKETKAERLNIPSLSGEIDLVAFREGSDTIWLLEAKDPVTVHSTPQLRGQLDDFYTDRKKPCYATQLGRKLADLQPYATEIAAALGVKSPFEGSVKAAFVTRVPIPAAFASGPFPFITLAQLPTLE